MALVFQAAADETECGNQTGPFVFGGWVAPVFDWQELFSKLWEDRVLNRRPAIQHLHVAELLSRHGRQKHGLNGKQAEARIDKAIAVIRRMPSLIPVWSSVDGAHFRETFAQSKFVLNKKQPGVFAAEPDYVAFQGFAIAVLIRVAMDFPQAQTVDFIVEDKGIVTTRMKEEFYDRLPNILTNRGLDHLRKLVGAFIRGTKDRAPLQAADLLIWHVRKEKSTEATAQERRRLKRMLDGRIGIEFDLPKDEVSAIYKRGKAEKTPSPFRSRTKPNKPAS